MIVNSGAIHMVTLWMRHLGLHGYLNLLRHRHDASVLMVHVAALRGPSSFQPHFHIQNSKASFWRVGPYLPLNTEVGKSTFYQNESGIFCQFSAIVFVWFRKCCKRVLCSCSSSCDTSWCDVVLYIVGLSTVEEARGITIKCATSSSPMAHHQFHILFKPRPRNL